MILLLKFPLRSFPVKKFTLIHNLLWQLVKQLWVSINFSSPFWQINSVWILTQTFLFTQVRIQFPFFPCCSSRISVSQSPYTGEKAAYIFHCPLFMFERRLLNVEQI